MSIEIVSTGGSPYRVQREDGSVVSEHATQHVATMAALNEAQASGQTVYVRRGLELRATVATDGTVEPEPEPEPDPAVEVLHSFDFEDGAAFDQNPPGFRWHSFNRTSIVRDDGCVVYNNGPLEPPNCGHEHKLWESSPFSPGSHAMRFRYPAGQAMAEQRWSMDTPLRDLFARWSFRVPLNFFHPGGNNKLYMFWMDGYSAAGDGSSVGMEMRGTDPAGSARWYVKVSAGRKTLLGGDQASAPFISYPDDQGRWMQIGAHIRAESSEDAGDGLVEVFRRWHGEPWERTHHLTAQPIRVPSAGPDGFAAGYLMGWANGAYQEETEFLLDDFAIAEGPLWTL